MQQRKISFIGGGNMAQAIINGMLKSSYTAEKVLVSDPGFEKLQPFAERGVNIGYDNNAMADNAEVVVLAVKPQLMKTVSEEMQETNFTGKLLISIAAGVSVTRLHALFPTATSIVRVMPNTPALVSEGMSGVYAAPGVSVEDKQFAEELMSAVGEVCSVVQESDINTVTAASGSSPAYFFLFMEAMQQVAMQMGLDEHVARKLAQQSALGAAKMVIENPQTEISTLRENVTSKGGTTATALAVFNDHKFSKIIQEAMQAAVARAVEMESLF